jgi:hypothetical protein
MNVRFRFTLQVNLSLNISTIEQELMKLGTFPVILGEAPPPDASQKRGYRVMYNPEGTLPKVDQKGFLRRTSGSPTVSKTKASKKKSSSVSGKNKGTSKTAKIELSSKAAKAKSATKSVKTGKSTKVPVKSSNEGSAESTLGQSPRTSKRGIEDEIENTEEETMPAKKQRLESVMSHPANLSDGPDEQPTLTPPIMKLPTPDVEKITSAAVELLGGTSEQKGDSNITYENSNKGAAKLTASNAKIFHDDKGNTFVDVGEQCPSMITMEEYNVLMRLGIGK